MLGEGGKSEGRKGRRRQWSSQGCGGEMERVKHKETKRYKKDRLCGLVVRVLSYRSGGPGSITGTTRKKVVDLEQGPLSLVSTTEELLDRKVAALVYKTENTD
jgi:hypothetical protein